ncbi:MAG: ATP phosphoribosyltransferase regulatory subunit, partial [Sedimentisphaerales bacterium]|nr:ATP phosphoribosyltransferase regulatory subunit [Sedimentisphaerales bacterium]
ARMVNQQINSLARPIKWFSQPRLCRAERPQRGRLREFFQWNVDVIGSDSVLADAECIYTAIDYLRSVGLSGDDVVVKISSRSMLAALLLDMEFAREQLDTIYALLDKRPKVSEEAFGEMAAESVPDETLRGKLMEILAIGSTFEELDKFLARKKPSDRVQDEIFKLGTLFDLLKKMGVGDYCEFDIKIVRGLAYYTGPVYEIFDRKVPLRALCGGGRYDNLLKGLGGPNVPATGFGMGDVVLELMLAERGLLKSEEQKLDFFVIDARAEMFDKVLEITSELRSKGFAAGFSYKRMALGKQLRQAAGANAAAAVIVGQETVGDGQVVIKKMASGEQVAVDLTAFLEKPEQQEMWE